MIPSSEPWLELAIPGNPRPKERPRFAGHAYTTAATAAGEDAIAWEARAAMHGRPAAKVPLVVFVDFYRSTARRCDIDNLAKLVLDALNGIVWADDHQIEHLTLRRTIDRARPRTEITVWVAE